MPESIPNDWTLADNALVRTIPRADFVEALAFVLEVGRLAEAANHHPDVGIRGYRTVHLKISTHSAGNTVTEKDFDLARKINDLTDERIRLISDRLKESWSA